MQLLSLEQLPKVDDIKEVSIDNLIETFKLCQKMEILCRNERGIGLSAVQVGIPLKLFIIETNPGVFDYFLNVKYEKAENSKEVLSLEGCLSIRRPNKQIRYFQVPRQSDIKVSGLRLKTDPLCVEEFSSKFGLDNQSIVFQHEADHGNGITIDQIGKEVLIWS